MSNLNQQIKQQAAELGFVACGITAATPAQSYPHYRRWLEQGYHATMQWLGREAAAAKRADVREVLPGAKSVVCVAMHYRTQEPWDEATQGKVARYARGDDYHDFMTQRLRQLLGWIQEQTPCSGRVYVDTGPILERELAQRAGLGWIGKNTMLLSREFGSYVLLGEILLDIELAADRPHLEQYCGSCTRCLDACPTNAFAAPYVLDANKCISFHTIENRETPPKELRVQFGNWVFGCDICQEVCPWNNKSQAHSAEPGLWTRDAAPTLLETLMMPQEEFSRRFKGSPLKRPKRRGMRRNALTVLKNRKRHLS
ncbi:MAG: tRNA epoxyqueuosine(34) reductase QueG [Abitibacteriaceae bacterium]|nr:tRNA epoxyqueuosine(34) reductase QueG [Abditibacteriaceae bacterium]MBV9866225.1 tRNA epoxyqueuosine(34) reductase QueG [Abditibacteriaceae bacterium]